MNQVYFKKKHNWSEKHIEKYPLRNDGSLKQNWFSTPLVFIKM